MISNKIVKQNLTIRRERAMHTPQRAAMNHTATQLLMVLLFDSQIWAFNGNTIAMYRSNDITKIVRKDASRLVNKIDNMAFFRAWGSLNAIWRPHREEFKPVRRSAMARFAIKYAPLEVKIVDLYCTIAIKSRPFRTKVRIPMTVIKI